MAEQFSSHTGKAMSVKSINESSIRIMVDTFYAGVREDAVLAPVFEKMLAGKWETHMPRMYAFWTKLLLGTGEFQGNVFGKHMALEGIEKEHFIHWLGLFRKTAVEIFGKDEAHVAIEVAERIAGSLQLGYFGEQIEV
ncbi:group III truncated hemoglobin [Herbaspirillum sp. GCM10030257]|uniref:group III truncated hemoglobin n=1 Tax=Herbaspirillum sp. GCM10030257 TaxID=3273393 RepID=UPI0036D42393